MTTLAPAARTTLTSRPLVIAAVGLVLVIAIAVLSLALSPASTSRSSAAPGSPASYQPLIQYRGTGAPPQRHETGTTLGSATVSIRHSYGAQP